MSERYQRVKVMARERLIELLLFLLLVLFITVYLWNHIVITILPGEAGVIWQRFNNGTQIKWVYPEGMRLIFPWDRMYIYNVRVQQTAHKFYVLTKNGLKIDLSISIRYFPEYKMLGILHKTVGPKYVETVVIPEIESVLRVLIGRLEAEQVYQTEGSIIEKSLNQAIEQIAQRFITVDNVIIKRMEFPPEVATAIENKIMQKHRVAAERYEAERKLIEAGAYKRYHDILLSSLTEKILRWRGIQATLELARSNNSKVVVIGSGKDQFQLFGDVPLEPGAEAIFPNATGIPAPITAVDIPGVSGMETVPSLSPETPEPDTNE